MLKYHLVLIREDPGDNAFVVADNSLAKSTLKWIPKKTNG